MLSFTSDQNKNCEFVTLQYLSAGAWANTSFTSPTTSLGLNEFRLVHSTISNPPQIAPLSEINASIGLKFNHDSLSLSTRLLSAALDVTLSLAAFAAGQFDAQSLGANKISTACTEFAASATISPEMGFLASFDGMGHVAMFDSATTSSISLLVTGSDISIAYSMPSAQGGRSFKLLVLLVYKSHFI